MASFEKSSALAVLITGLLALFGTIAGGVLKWYWEKQLSDQKLYSSLILKALESDSAEERLSSLQFILDTNLKKDQAIREGVNRYVQRKKGDAGRHSPLSGGRSGHGRTRYTQCQDIPARRIG